MNTNIIQGNWNILKGKAKEQWGKLTDDDLEKIEGNRDQLLGQIQKMYGLSHEEVDKQIKEWESRH